MSRSETGFTLTAVVGLVSFFLALLLGIHLTLNRTHREHRALRTHLTAESRTEAELGAIVASLQAGGVPLQVKPIPLRDIGTDLSLLQVPLGNGAIQGYLLSQRRVRFPYPDWRALESLFLYSCPVGDLPARDSTGRGRSAHYCALPPQIFHHGGVLLGNVREERHIILAPQAPRFVVAAVGDLILAETTITSARPFTAILLATGDIELRTLAVHGSAKILIKSTQGTVRFPLLPELLCLAGSSSVSVTLYGAKGITLSGQPIAGSRIGCPFEFSADLWPPIAVVGEKPSFTRNISSIP